MSRQSIPSVFAASSVLAVSMIVLAGASAARADMYGLERATGPIATHAAIDQAPLFANDEGAGVSAHDAHRAPFTFSNFNRQGVTRLINSQGFSSDTNPLFVSMEDMITGFDSTVSTGRVGQRVPQRNMWGLRNRQVFHDVLDNLSEREQRVGNPVQSSSGHGGNSNHGGHDGDGDGDDDSNSGSNDGPPVVPAPGAMLLGMIGLASIGVMRRKFA